MLGFVSLRPSCPLSRCKRYYATSPARPAGTRKASTPRALLGRYPDTFPIELARVQSGRTVNLRDYESQVKLKRLSFDLKTHDGKVLPAMGENFLGPNGCSLREPFSPTFQEVVRNFRGTNILVYVIPEGTPVPKTLTLLHEHSDHFSLQCAEPMTLPELNKEITDFLVKSARAITKEEFGEQYPYEI
ncbi:hypothetical protein PCANC_24720 [Puccinia coronata f. sp. avenae]|uniref:Tse2 ADP-ribosyltransferase toxin domain-containing protein n=1 Tax=Puccinia coronata f. sp. avenae TaxID=200324 RepID=A0A2N5S3Q9_9BASI|nr:hypothetical protein PCANC_24720 [Puccinia coronata f. sp. avenae]PLW12429.1 hypothetical protein PCASD_21412 [Puccinia coronata f. sp. avenae]PLW51524.1 hypothetical protein PCASD_00293 [Puccinia coronata f. sp. avenae]